MSMNYVWSELRDRALEAFGGQTPRPEDESAIIDVFERHPMLVEHAISDVGAQLARGEIRWAWSVLRSRCERGAVPTRDAVPEDRTRDQRVAQARQWMHAAGIGFDREDEIDDELFGERGSLRWWRDDQALVAEMLSLWAQLRPLGVMNERAAIEYGERLLATRRVAIAKTKQPTNGTTTSKREPVPTSNPFLG